MDNTRTGPKVNSSKKLFTHNKLMHTQLTLIVAAFNTTCVGRYILRRACVSSSIARKAITPAKLSYCLLNS